MTRRFELPFAVGLMILAGIGLVMMMSRVALASGPKQDSYPPPVQTPAAIPTAEQANPTATTAAYPSTERDFWPATPISVGDQAAQNLPGGESMMGTQTAQQANERGLFYLWLGFIATFLIFGTSVLGATLLFTRRNES
jgi:hypothetical protein